MGLFLGLSYELRYTGTIEKSDMLQKVVRYIADNLRDLVWQDLISNRLCKVERHHKTIFIVLRLFDIKDIEEGNLKSYARYKKADDKLVIDQMLILNEYADLLEDEMKKKPCDDIFDYLKEILKKYKDRFLDFDSIAFLPLLEERFKKTKENKLPYHEYGNY